MRVKWVGSLGVIVGVLFCFIAVSHAELQLYEIYNALYDTSLSSNAQLESSYGAAADEVFFETDGYVRATARYAGYTQLFGWYGDLCIGSSATWTPLFNVTTNQNDFLYRCTDTNQPCINTDDCPAGTCNSVSGNDYDAYILIGGGQSLIGFFDDPSGSPPWYSQTLLNSDGGNHMKTFRAPDYHPLTNPEYFIGWEDLPASSWDADYQDLVVVIKNLEPSSFTCCDSDDDCPDDGLFCNGEEICVDSVCTHSGNPCEPLACIEDDTVWGEGSCAPDSMMTYRFDFDGDELWDTEWCLDLGETLEVEIWVADYSLPTDMFGTAFFFAYDTSALQVNVDQSYVCDTNHGGPWHPFWTMLEEEDGVRIEIHAASFSGVPVPGGKIKIALLQLERIAGGDSQIATEDGIVIDMNALQYVPTNASGLIKDCSSLDDQCNAGVCDPDTGECEQDPAPKNGLPCDDGEPCTVNDTCTNGACSGTAKDCSSFDDQCNVGVCDPDTGECEKDPAPKNGLSCNDGNLCTLNDVCSNGTCSGTAKDCSSFDDQCNVGVCDPDTGECEKDPTPKNGLSCNDGNPCTESDICTDGVCAGTLIPQCQCKMKIYRGGTCERGEEIIDPAYNRPGRRGLALTCCEEVTFCLCSNCDPETDCPEWSAAVVEGDTSITLVLVSNPDGSVTLHAPCPCPDELTLIKVSVYDPCNNNYDEVFVTVGRVILGISDTNAHPDTDSIDVVVNLTNPDHYVKALMFTLQECNKDAPDNLACYECDADEDRAPNFFCSAVEQLDGTCKITMWTTENSLIARGSGPIANVKFNVGEIYTSKDCVCLEPANINAADRFNEQVCVCPETGQVCFYICGDVYPQDCYACASCGDGEVNLFDILEEVDIILGLQTASACQLLHGNVPPGMPPYCGTPSGETNCDAGPEVIDIFDAIVILDKGLGKMNCCDYCFYGRIN